MTLITLRAAALVAMVTVGVTAQPPRRSRPIHTIPIRSWRGCPSPGPGERRRKAKARSLVNPA